MLRIKVIVKKTFFILFYFSIFSILPTAIAVDYNSKLLFSKDCLLENKQYTVKKVFDGDTIIISNEKGNNKVRLLGIDAFEHEQNIYGIKAKDFLSMLALNKAVCLETDIQKKDIYGRTLGYVFIGTLSVNEELLKNGLAILCDFPPNIKYINKLKKAQIYARENMLGVWKEHNYIPETPSQWRHRHPLKKKEKKVPF